MTADPGSAAHDGGWASGYGANEFPADLYRALAENAADAVCLQDPDGLIRWVSMSVTQMLGWEPQELLGTAAAEDLVHPDDREAMLAMRRRALSGEPGKGLLVRVRTRPGDYLRMSALTRPLCAPDGTAVGTIVALRDVGNLVAAREAAARARQEMQALFDSMLEPHMLMQAVRDDDGQVIDFLYAQANRAAVEPMGADPVGHRVLELWPDVRGREQVKQFAQWLASDQPVVLDDWAYPHQPPGQERRYDIRAVRVGDSLLFAWRDVTERHRMARELAESEARFRLLTENATDAVFQLDRDGTIRWGSRGAERLTGLRPEELVGRNLIDLVADADRVSLEALRPKAMAGRPTSARFRVVDVEGSTRWVHGTSRPLLDAEGAVVGRVIGWRDVQAEVLAEQRLHRRAHTDTLTGLLNRGEMLSRLAALLADGRQAGTSLAVAFCDLDDFKDINDRHGHAAGDALLRATAARIRGCLRAEDLVGRMGGDEILVVITGVHDLADAATVAETIRDVVSLPVQLEGCTVLATISVGITMAAPGDDLDTMINRADTAMYEAKRTGRNRVVQVRADPGG